MSYKKYVVPEGMLKAACVEYPDRNFDPDGIFTRPVLEAAIAWLAGHPIKPTIQQLQEMYDSPDCPKEGTYVPYYLCEWQRRMFLAPEPDIPEAIKDLIVAPHGSFFSDEQSRTVAADCNRQNAKLIEAYNRGKAGK